MRPEVTASLACPSCEGDVEADGPALRCAGGHAFDIARQGYASLLSGAGAPGSADTPAMVAARDAFLRAGHFSAITKAVAGAAGDVVRSASDADDPPLVVDAGAGTGHHLAAVLDEAPSAVGLALDASKHAARRAAKAHPRADAAVCDVWGRLPVRSDAATVLLDVFSPRNPAEFRRVVRPDGALVVVTPRAEHLRELVRALELLEVDARKEERLAEALAPHFRLEDRRERLVALALSRADAEAAALMGPSGHHLDGERLRQRLAAVVEPVRVTAAFAVSIYRSR